MTCNVDFSTASATLLTMELDEILFAGLSAGESLVMEFSVSVGNTYIDNWSVSYFADNNGEIRLSALGRMWNRYIMAYRRRTGGEGDTPQLYPDKLSVEMTYTMEDETTATCTRHLLYSRRAGSTLSGLTARLPLLSKVKHTAPTAKEYAWALSSLSGLTINVSAIYVKNGVQSTASIGSTPFSWTSSGGGGSVDVSPSVISNLLPSGAELKEYTVKMMQSGAERDTCRYIVDQSVVREFCYLNRFGVYETLLLRGGETLKPERAATFGWMGDNWSALDMEVNDEYECSTGYIGDDEWRQARDLSESPIVWLWNGAWQRVTITSVKQEKTRPTNEARASMITYRLSDRELLSW